MQGNSESVFSRMDYFSEAASITEKHYTIADLILCLRQAEPVVIDYYIVSEQLH